MSPKNGSGNGNGQAAQAGKAVPQVMHLFTVVADGGGQAHSVDMGVSPPDVTERFDVAGRHAKGTGVVGVYELPFSANPAEMHQTMMGSKGVKADLARNRLTLTAPSSDPSRSPAVSASVEQPVPAPN